MFTASSTFALLAVFAGSSALAQSGTASGQVSSFSSVSVSGSPAVDDSQRNQPYTLTQQTTTVRTLGDGTHITTVREETRMRDAEGRTRTEITRDSQGIPGLRTVQIFDPVAHTWTLLDERTKVAQVHHLPVPKARSPEEDAHLAQMRADAQAARAAQPQAGNAAGPQSSPKISRDVQVLAPRTIAGLVAEGRRVTRTIPAGKEGNDRDMVTVTETWTSPELHTVLERSTDGPQFGKVNMTTTSLERASPDPALFSIPTDYKVLDQQPTALE